MVLGPPWAPPVSRYVFREVSGTLLSSILGDFWGTLGSHVSNFFGRVFLTVFRSPPEITFYCLLLNFGSILEPNWSQNGSQGPPCRTWAGYAIYRICSTWAPPRDPWFRHFFWVLPGRGSRAPLFMIFCKFRMTSGPPFSTTWAPFRVAFVYCFFKCIFNRFLSKMGLKSEGAFL